MCNRSEVSKIGNYANLRVSKLEIVKASFPMA